MRTTRLRIPVPPGTLAAAVDDIRRELELAGDFPPEADREAQQAAAAAAVDEPRLDAREIPLVTVDPPGSRDLDQALHLARHGRGFRLTYAIADAAAFVGPGGAVDAEARRRGQTLYAPGARVPLHPPVLSEGAASLLPDVDRPALLWRIDTDADAEPVHVDVRRAVVRSRAQLTYAQVQDALDAGPDAAPEPVRLLPDFGRLRQDRERDRGAVVLPTPAQEVVPVDGGFALAYVAPLAVEEWNAQLSLLTGMCAARLMLDAGVGVLRTLAPPSPDVVMALREAATLLGVAWHETVDYPEFVSGLDPEQPGDAALLALAPSLLRGAGYVAFDGAPPEQVEHGAIAAPYAHVTAPLRRLVDRFGNEVVLAAATGGRPPAWVTEALPVLPDLMAASVRRQRDLDRLVLDYVEAALLEARVGEEFDAVTVEVGEGSALVHLADPAVVARASGSFTLGRRTRVRLVAADPARRHVEFAAAEPR